MTHLRTMALLATLLILPSLLPAVNAEDYSIVNSWPRLPLLVNGVEVPSHELPLNVPPNSTVCVPRKIVYTDIDRRYVFKQWSDGGKDLCAQTPVNGTLTAIYGEEVLVQVFSDVEKYSMSIWVKAGTRLNLTVDPVVYGEPGVRYVFRGWSGGERPFDPENYIAAVNPVRLQINWEKQYHLTLTSSFPQVKVNGTGWYRAGDLAVIAAPKEIMLDDRRKLVFDEWVSVGPIPVIINNPSAPVTSLIMDAPHQIQAKYSEYFLVEIHGVEDEIIYRAWIKKGEPIQVNVGNIIEVIPHEMRYVFRGWNESTVPQLPSFTINVDKPLIIKSLYEKQYYVRVVSEYGGIGEGWYPENSTALIQAPSTPQTVLFLKRVFKGWEGSVKSNSSDSRLLLKVDKPLNLRASYILEIDLPSLLVVIGVASALTIVGLHGFKGKKKEETPLTQPTRK